MLRHHWQTLGILALVGVMGCGRPALDDPKLSPQDLDLETYFHGETVAYGQFQDRFGTIRRRFKVEISGDWDGDVLTLDERFFYSDGATERRVWRLRKTGAIGPDQTWEGTADGVRGVAIGAERGDTFKWRYQFDLPKPGGQGTMAVRFDDWMWLLEDGRLLNRAYLSRFGVTLGEVTLFFERR